MEKKEIKKVVKEVQSFVIEGINEKTVNAFKTLIKELIEMGIHDCYELLFRDKIIFSKGVHKVLVTVDWKEVNNISLTWCGTFDKLKSIHVNETKEIKSRITTLLNHHKQNEYRMCTEWGRTCNRIPVLVEKNGTSHFIRNNKITTVTPKEIDDILNLDDVCQNTTLGGERIVISELLTKSSINSRLYVEPIGVSDIRRVYNVYLKLNGRPTLVY